MSAREKGLTYRALMARKSWSPLPSAAVLAGTADFFKSLVLKRFTKELFGDGPQEGRRFQGPSGERGSEELPLATVLDELRTPSFFSPYRLVVVEKANAFIAAMFGVIFAQPLGRLVQERLTTSPDLLDVEVVGTKVLAGQLRKVQTRSATR